MFARKKHKPKAIHYYSVVIFLLLSILCITPVFLCVVYGTEYETVESVSIYEVDGKYYEYAYTDYNDKTTLKIYVDENHDGKYEEQIVKNAVVITTDESPKYENVTQIKKYGIFHLDYHYSIVYIP